MLNYTSSPSPIRRLSHPGFTLIELLIAVAIVAILAAVAYPAYTEQVRRGLRKECSTALTAAMQAQERFYSNPTNNAYSSNIATVFRSYSGDTSASESACSLSASTCGSTALSACVRVTATSNRGDSDCATMSLDSTNLRGAKDSAGNDTTTKCWR